MIPKIIHCIWLSGDEKPRVYRDCIATWKEVMPEYEIKEWSKEDFPIETVPWVKTACDCKKWAYAADYIRLYALYHFGGIYLDMDVCVYKPFDPFLLHPAFSCVEFFPDTFYKSIGKKEVIGCGIEAAVLGAMRGHPWIKECLQYYENKNFYNEPKFYYRHIMPRVLTRVARENYGFKYVPIHQVLRHGIHIYGPDTFSSIYNFEAVTGQKKTWDAIKMLGIKDPARFAFHLCNHGWWDGITEESQLVHNLKKIIMFIFGRRLVGYIKKKLSRDII